MTHDFGPDAECCALLAILIITLPLHGHPHNKAAAFGKKRSVLERLPVVRSDNVQSPNGLSRCGSIEGASWCQGSPVEIALALVV
jgi:hypothetical protein